MDYEYYPTGQVNWNRMIEEFAKEEGKNFGRIMTHLSCRPSLNAAAEMLGLKEVSTDVLNQLDRFLDSKGFAVPPLLPIAKTDDMRRPRSRQSGTPKFSMTRVQYLVNRSRGMTRTEIAREAGITLPALYPHLAKWGVKSPVDEEAAILSMNENFAGATQSVVQPSASEENAPEPDKHPETETQEMNYITIRVPLRETTVPEESANYLNREQIAHDMCLAVERAVGYVRRDVIALLGEEDVQERVQQYFDRQFARYEESRV